MLYLIQEEFMTNFLLALILISISVTGVSLGSGNENVRRIESTAKKVLYAILFIIGVLIALGVPVGLPLI